MKKSTITLAFLLLVAFQTAFSANINITISGFAYSPNATSAVVGDVVTIAASVTHPLVQLDQATWLANGNTPMGGGWGVKTASYTFTVTTVGIIYYGCQNHIATMQMKGVVQVAAAGITQATAAAYNISLYPNPIANGEFTVKAEGYNSNNDKIMIYDTEGKLAETHNLTGTLTPVKTKLPAGVYFYDVMINAKQVYRSKFLITSNK